MKKTLTTLLAAITCLSMIQAQPTPTYQNTEEAVNFDKLHANYPWIFGSINNKYKKDQYEGWYSYVDEARGVGVSWTNITNTSLFPDSTVYQLYGNGNNGVELGFVGLHNIGEVLDPKYEFFPVGEQLSRFNPYTCDSVSFFYRYSYNKQGTTDTLRIQFYVNGHISQVNFGGNVDSSVSVRYDATQNRTTGNFFASEIEIYLDGDDTTGDDPSDAKLMTVAVPNGGLLATPNGAVGRNNVGLVAFTMTFHPGYTYSYGDTLQHDWEETPVVNKLNHFRPTRVSDRGNSYNSSQNRGLFIFTSNLYDNANSGWANLFVPSNAFNDSKDHLYALFHCIANNVSTGGALEGYMLGQAYPNPANQGAEVNIDFSLAQPEEVTIELYSINGIKAATVTQQAYNAGEHTVNFNTAELASGLYFYKITAGAYTANKKLSIY